MSVYKSAAQSATQTGGTERDKPPRQDARTNRSWPGLGLTKTHETLWNMSITSRHPVTHALTHICFLCYYLHHFTLLLLRFCHLLTSSLSRLSTKSVAMSSVENMHRHTGSMFVAERMKIIGYVTHYVMGAESYLGSLPYRKVRAESRMGEVCRGWTICKRTARIAEQGR